jgi:uncharacterized membrane protein
MPLLVVAHIVFISTWVGSLMLVMALCADRAAGSAWEDEPLITLSLSLFAWVASGAAVLGVLSGMWLAYLQDFDGGWLPSKLVFVAALSWLHVYVGHLTARLRDGVSHRPRYYWAVSSLPALLALPILYLVLAKPL